MSLGISRAVHRYASTPGAAETINDLNDMIIATSYPRLVAKHLADEGVIPRSIVELEGAVETSLQLGLADAIADVMVTGVGLSSLGLTVVGDPLMESEGIVIRPSPAADTDPDIRRFLGRLSGVLIARDYVMIDYHVEQSRLETATRIAPGLESPTVAPLSKAGWFAVRVMVSADRAHQVMDLLEQVGATGIVSTKIQSARAPAALHSARSGGVE